MKTFVAIIAALVGVSAAPVSNAVSISPTSDDYPVIQALLRAVAEVSDSIDVSKGIDLDNIIRTISGTTVRYGPYFKVENFAADAQLSSNSTKSSGSFISSDVNFKVELGSGHTQTSCSSSSLKSWSNMMAPNLPLTGPIACSDAKTFFFLMPAFEATRLGLLHVRSDEAVSKTSYTFGLHTITQQDLFTNPNKVNPSVVYQGPKTINVPSLNFDIRPTNHAVRTMDEHTGIDALVSTLAGVLEISSVKSDTKMHHHHGLPFQPAQNISIENVVAKAVAAQEKQSFSIKVAETINFDVRLGPNEIPVKCNFDSNRVSMGWANGDYDLDIRLFNCSDKKIGVVLAQAPKHTPNERFPGYTLSIFKPSPPTPSSWTIFSGVHFIGMKDIKTTTRPGSLTDTYEFSYAGPKKFIVPGYKISISGSMQDGMKIDRPSC